MSQTMKLFAAMRGKECIGVFSQEDRAAVVACDEIVPMEPAWMEGTPAPCGHVCCASGTWITLERIECGLNAEYTDVGPCWGVNVQSAIGGLFGQPVTRRSSELTSVQLYEIDRDYSVRLPENLKHLYGALCDTFAEDEIPDEKKMTFDYIDLHLQNLRYLEEQGSKYDSLYLACIVDALAEQAWGHTRVRCANPVEHYRQRMERRFAHFFTLTELRILTVLWGLRADDAVTGQLISGRIPPEQAQDILERAQLCRQPRVKLQKKQGNPEE